MINTLKELHQKTIQHSLAGRIKLQVPTQYTKTTFTPNPLQNILFIEEFLSKLKNTIAFQTVLIEAIEECIETVDAAFNLLPLTIRKGHTMLLEKLVSSIFKIINASKRKRLKCSSI